MTNFSQANEATVVNTVKVDPETGSTFALRNVHLTFQVPFRTLWKTLSMSVPQPI